MAVNLDKTLKFHHKDDPMCIYTRQPNGIISWECYDVTQVGGSGDAGEDGSYSDDMVNMYFKDGTWVEIAGLQHVNL